MKLSEYLAANNITHSAFGALIGTSQAAVSRYANGDRLPKKAIMERIQVATEGAVTPNDFMSEPANAEPPFTPEAA